MDVMPPGRDPRRAGEQRVSPTAASLAMAALLAALAVACLPPSVQRPGRTDDAPPGLASGTPAATATATLAPAGSVGPSVRPSFVRPTPTPQPTFLAYVVKAGDTLTSIAREYRTTPRSIAFWNREAHPSLDPDAPDYRPNRIEVGWVLLLLPDVEADPEDFL